MQTSKKIEYPFRFTKKKFYTIDVEIRITVIESIHHNVMYFVNV